MGIVKKCEGTIFAHGLKFFFKFFFWLLTFAEWFHSPWLDRDRIR